MQSTKKAPKKGIRLLLTVFGGILAVMLLAVAVLVTIPLIEGVDAAPVAGSANWMAGLPNDVPLGELSIPGTHDAGAQYVSSAFSQSARPGALASSWRMASAILTSALPSAGTGSA